MKVGIMNNKTNLRFLLALGNQKVVVLDQPEGARIYTEQIPGKTNVSLRHICDAFSAHSPQQDKPNLCEAK